MVNVTYFVFMRIRGPHWSRPFGLPRESNWRGVGSNSATFLGRKRGNSQSELNRGRRSEGDELDSTLLCDRFAFPRPRSSVCDSGWGDEGNNDRESISSTEK